MTDYLLIHDKENDADNASSGWDDLSDSQCSSLDGLSVCSQKVSFSEHCQIFCIPRYESSHKTMCFAMFKMESWVEDYEMDRSLDSGDPPTYVAHERLSEFDDHLSRRLQNEEKLLLEQGCPATTVDTFIADSESRRVSFSMAHQVIDIPKIDDLLQDLYFYSRGEIAQFRHDAWVQETGLMDPDNIVNESMRWFATETQRSGVSTGDYLVNKPSRSVKAGAITQVKTAEATLVSPTSNNFLIADDMEQVATTTKAACRKLSTANKENKEHLVDIINEKSLSEFGAEYRACDDDDDRTESTVCSQTSGSAEEDFNVVHVSAILSKESFLAKETSKKSVAFSDDIQMISFPKISQSDWHSCFYDDDEIAEFRHEAWCEECGLQWKEC